MELFTTIADLRRRLDEWRRLGETIALVPTMGNLHAGHLALVERAQQLAQRVVVSLFVNPAQFGPQEDFEHYPRTPDADIALLTQHGTDAVFMPSISEMYPQGHAVARIEIPELSSMLCGAGRPGHFSGVATVVTKLFNIVRPDMALFGEKDYQQLLVIRQMVVELCFPIRIVGVPTVREADGLAMSSRNRYLSAAERARAPALNQMLQHLARAVKSGDEALGSLEATGARMLIEAGFVPEYVRILRLDLNDPAANHGELMVLAAARLGATRLIDNLRIKV